MGTIHVTKEQILTCGGIVLGTQMLFVFLAKEFLTDIVIVELFLNAALAVMFWFYAIAVFFLARSGIFEKSAKEPLIVSGLLTLVMFFLISSIINLVSVLSKVSELISASS